MSNTPLRTLTFPGLDDTYTIPQKVSDLTNDSKFQTESQVNGLIAPTESSLVASQAYSEGDYFIYSHTLYKVIDDIASGGTIVIDTNAEATTIMAEILAVISSLT